MVHSNDREAWLAARMSLVTASDVAAMLGECAYKSREQLRMEKARLAEHWEGNESTELGNAMEPVILDIARKRWWPSLAELGCLIKDCKQPRLGGTPDATFDSPWGRAIAQIKFTSCAPTEACKPLKSGKPSTAAFAGGPPLRMQLQVQTELAVMNCDHGVLLVLHTSPGFRLRSYYIPRHEGVIAKIRSEVDVFWGEVEKLKNGELG